MQACDLSFRHSKDGLPHVLHFPLETSALSPVGPPRPFDCAGRVPSQRHATLTRARACCRSAAPDAPTAFLVMELTDG